MQHHDRRLVCRHGYARAAATTALQQSAGRHMLQMQSTTNTVDLTGHAKCELHRPQQKSASCCPGDWTAPLQSRHQSKNCLAVYKPMCQLERACQVTDIKQRPAGQKDWLQYSSLRLEQQQAGLQHCCRGSTPNPSAFKRRAARDSIQGIFPGLCTAEKEVCHCACASCGYLAYNTHQLLLSHQWGSYRRSQAWAQPNIMLHLLLPGCTWRRFTCKTAACCVA